jgi:CXXX repeat modification system protein
MKKIETISSEDSEKMRLIFERKVALENLTKMKEKSSFLLNDELYERFLADYSRSIQELKACWSYMAEKYHLESVAGGHWDIDFSTGDIYLFPGEN